VSFEPPFDLAAYVAIDIANEVDVTPEEGAPAA
jgi:hypothetical protein